MASPCFVALVLILLSIGVCVGRPLHELPSKLSSAHKQPLQNRRPYNVAHRGSNGEFPEETAAAYMRAIEEGADFIETDIQATKDGMLICAHDLILDETTDIASHKEFAHRRTTYEVQWQNLTGWFIADFTLAELKTLRTKQRYSFRDQQYNGQFPIITFEEYISIVMDAERTVGIYPEIKNPVFVNQKSYWEITSDEYLRYISKYVFGIGPWKDTVVPVNNNYLNQPTDLVANAHALGLQVHPYTFRNENSFLHFNFHQDPYLEYDYWLNKVRVDGLFTDFTGSLHNYLELTFPLKLTKNEMPGN